MKQTTRIKLFISRPSDVIEEIDSIRLIIEEINKTPGKTHDYTLQMLNWDVDTYTAIGEDPQDVINTQIDNEYDILIGIIWKKLGTPTLRDKSGTVEEINRCIAHEGKYPLIYFKTKVENLNEINLDELQKINDFKKDLTSRGALYKEYSTINEFESKIRINLMKLIDDILSGNQINNTKEQPFQKINKYTEIDELLDLVENKDVEDLDIDLFQLADVGATYLNNITTSLNSFTSIFGNFTESITSKTNEFNRYAHSKDEKLKALKSKSYFNSLASIFDDHVSRIRLELPIFAENFRSLTETYPIIHNFVETYKNSETIKLKESVIQFRDSMEYLIKGSAELIKEVMGMPPINSRFNQSKREVEIVLKDMTREMLAGLKIFDELLDK